MRCRLHFSGCSSWHLNFSKGAWLVFLCASRKTEAELATETRRVGASEIMKMSLESKSLSNYRNVVHAKGNHRNQHLDPLHVARCTLRQKHASIVNGWRIGNTHMLKFVYVARTNGRRDVQVPGPLTASPKASLYGQCSPGRSDVDSFLNPKREPSPHASARDPCPRTRMRSVTRAPSRTRSRTRKNTCTQPSLQTRTHYTRTHKFTHTHKSNVRTGKRSKHRHKHLRQLRQTSADAHLHVHNYPR